MVGRVQRCRTRRFGVALEENVISIVVFGRRGVSVEETVESALAQTDVEVDVVVVAEDDGAADAGSVEVGVRRVVATEPGDLSAINAGFAAASGDVVIFADAGDQLSVDVGSRAAGMFSAEPSVAQVSWATGPSRPAEGDLRDVVLRDGVNFRGRAWSIGCAFRRSVLERLMPLPAERADLGARGSAVNFVLATLVPLFGRTVALELPAGSGAVGPQPEIGQLAERFDLARRLLAEHAAQIGASVDPAAWRDPPPVSQR